MKNCGFCEDAKKQFNLDVACCVTCHIECDEYGYPMCHIEACGQEYEVCCAVSSAKEVKGKE